MKKRTKIESSVRTHRKPPPFLPDHPTLANCSFAILAFIRHLHRLNNNLSFGDSFREIMIDAQKFLHHEIGALSASVIFSKWQKLSNEILFQAQQLNQEAKKAEMHDRFSTLRTTIISTHNAQPPTIALKKEHHSLYMQMKKSLSVIHHHAELNEDSDTIQLLKKFRNELNHNFARFFQIAQLDRIASAQAHQTCKTCVKQIQLLLAGTNPLIQIPQEISILTKFLNSMKLAETPRRSKTPPARLTAHTNILNCRNVNNSNVNSNLKSNKKTTTNNKNEIKVKGKAGLSNVSTSISSISHMSQNSRSKTPPSRPVLRNEQNLRTKTKEPTFRSNLSSPIKPSNKLSPRHSPKTSQKTSFSHSLPKKPTISTYQSNLSSSALKTKSKTPQRLYIPTKSHENSVFNIRNNDTKIQENRRSDLKKQEKSSFDCNPISRPKKSINRNDNKSPEIRKQNIPKGNLVSSNTPILQKQVQISPENSFSRREFIPRNMSIQSFDSATDQIVQAINKTKEQVAESSPILNQLQQDLSDVFDFYFNTNDSLDSIINKMFDSFSKKLQPYEKYVDINDQLQLLVDKISHHKISDIDAEEEISSINDFIVDNMIISNEQKRIYSLAKEIGHINTELCSINNLNVQQILELAKNVEFHFQSIKISNEKDQNKLTEISNFFSSSISAFYQNFLESDRISQQNIAKLTDQFDSNDIYNFEKLPRDEIFELHRNLSLKLSNFYKKQEEEIKSFTDHYENSCLHAKNHYQELSSIHNQIIELQNALESINWNSITFKGQQMSRNDLENEMMFLLNKETQILESLSSCD
ncbi:hypothetical protein TRFO_39420 [Tritrichomonas foetus]|uniref:Uncharacterized protein n=1 Tax=Tritrichomonas foetus TaxID=1144522 RepID=A0A1J4J4Z6_9EUKA|nr:hypothetical protein TRFO_39420 [Tritrichomonas foetus]|eukprot:OHS94390.1 hypothetical protein TRFO_39420 [Tritrichomonas foetus]